LFDAVISRDILIIQDVVRNIFWENKPFQILFKIIFSLSLSDSLTLTDSIISSVITLISIKSQIINQVSGVMLMSLYHCISGDIYVKNILSEVHKIFHSISIISNCKE
jgi:hypothetical protein